MDYGTTAMDFETVAMEYEGVCSVYLPPPPKGRPPAMGTV